MRDIGRVLCQLHALQRLVHRLGQVVARQAGNGRNVKHIDRHGASYTPSCALVLERDGESVLGEAALACLVGKDKVRARKFAIGRDKVVERVGRHGLRGANGHNLLLLLGRRQQGPQTSRCLCWRWRRRQR